MKFPTLKPCAATVNAGFTAAEEGKKLESTTKRLS
jgi:hypothetical protein